MIKIKHELTSGTGYIVLEKFIPRELIDYINLRLHELHPVRASNKHKKYAENDEIKNLQDICVWWSQMVLHWYEVQLVDKLLYPVILEHLPNSVLYSSDFVTIEPNTNWINPHVDTPHRFEKYNYDKRLLGIQCVVALDDLDSHTGATGLVPKSQNIDFNIHLCYKGLYKEFFKTNCIQPKLPKGSVLLYNSRVLHSSMPIEQKTNRPALLLNYLDSSIIDDVKSMDNIWGSNGNS